MAEGELEQGMLRFVRREADILVATTIIESGLDIPNANTIFINQADNYGLADLHQLRGRTGRYKRRAYAYLLLDGEKALTPNASRRLKAIEEFTELGAGFKIAMRDLEIRGAGSILGTQQSGHIVAVGFDLYCQLLEQAVAQLKGQKTGLRLDVDVRLDFVVTNEAEFIAPPTKPNGFPAAAKTPVPERIPAFIPVAYVSDPAMRIRSYREIAEIASREQLERRRRDWPDRFG